MAGEHSVAPRWRPQLPALGSSPDRHRFGQGAWLKDVDGRDLLDMSMGFGSMLVGHLESAVVEAVTKALDTGTLFVTPSPSTTDIAEALPTTFRVGATPVRQLRHRSDHVCGEGGPRVHQQARDHQDRGRLPRQLRRLVSLGQARRRRAGPGTLRFPRSRPSRSKPESCVVPYNDLDRLRAILANTAIEISAVVMEPVLEHLDRAARRGLPGGVRAACDEAGVCSSSTKSRLGLTAGYAGASQRLGSPRTW